MKSSFMERMLGGALGDHPPSPQMLEQPHTTTESTSHSAGPASPSAYSHQSQQATPAGLESILESKDAPTHFSAPNSPTSLRSQQTMSSRSSAKSSQPQHPATHPSTPTSPSVPSNPTVSSPSSHLTPPSPSSSGEGIDSETEYVAPLPGYGDPRFQYPSRISATVPYPEWRLHILRKAQRAGMGDVGRAMEMIYWGREDPVIAGASGVMNDADRMGMRWGAKSGTAGYIRDKGKGKRRESSGGAEDNVSSLGTIGPRTVGSGGTVKGVSIGSPTNQRRRVSVGGKSVKSIGSPKNTIPEIPREGGDSGNESSGENSDGSRDEVSTPSSAASEFSPPMSRRRSSTRMRFSHWSDDEEEIASEVEWLGWQMDINRQGKRQYAIQARRDANSAWGVDAELDLGVPVNPTDDMKKYMKNRHQLEPEASITFGRRPSGE